MNIHFQDQHAVVCGSTQGIGKAIATRFAECGAKLTLIARNEAKLQQTIKSLANSEKHDYLCIDFNNVEDLQKQIQTFAEQNSVHILVNNTGGPSPGPIQEASLENFQQAMTQHLLCNHTLVQTLLPSMQKMQYGRIINIISTSVKQPIENLGVSNTIRGAVASWAKTLAGELGVYNITVNNVLPGYTETERLQDIVNNRAKKQNKPPEQVIKEMQQSVPLKRFAKSEEVAAAVLFLASEEAGYISGINLPVDGGRTLCL